MTATPRSEIVSVNLPSQHCMTTLSLLLSVLLPLSVKLIFTYLQASRTKRCHLMSPWTLICLVLLFPPPPQGCGSPLCRLSPAGVPGSSASSPPPAPPAALPLVLTDSPQGKSTTQTAAFFSFLPQVLCPHSRTQRKITRSEVQPVHW